MGLVSIAVAAVMLVGVVPLTPQSMSWNKAGVSEAAFNADLDACWAVYEAELPDTVRRDSSGRSPIRNDLNRYRSDGYADRLAVNAWGDCFEARGYLVTSLSSREQRRIYGRSISEADQRIRLYEIATAERHTHPRRAPTVGG
ncbi:hypothetical protein [Maricaulis sp.]|uniref:hypothetical protein n=1 Tax=Maricaulis sp. TaxID=1486257 RepID=UPI003A92560A